MSFLASPDCAKFTVGALNEAVENLSDLFEFKLYPFGNAKYVNGSDVCQHGPEECYLNIIDNCAMAFANYSIPEYWPFFRCTGK